jgi:hypothetical protein
MKLINVINQKSIMIVIARNQLEGYEFFDTKDYSK